MRNQNGVTLVELVVFIVLVGIAFGALMLAFNQFGFHSTDPMIRKQSLAIAESLMDEVELMPFTYCDPDDPNASTAANTAGCTGGAAGSEDDSGTLGPEAGETRYSTATPFDNVSDYNGFSMTPGTTGGIRDITNTVVSGLSGYSASIVVAQAGLGGIAAADALRITVTVTAPNATTFELVGYRTRYAPRTAP